MSRVLSSSEGAMLVALARESITSSFADKEILISQDHKQLFSFSAGVFVTLRKFGRLRGCLGYARTSQPLYESLISAARSAAFQDPRYPPLQKSELPKVELEISLLTEPLALQKESPKDVLSNIIVGKDGIILSNNNFSGLMLPQVADKGSWSTEDFLKYTCTMFGLNEAAWLDPDSRLYKFRAKVFNEG
ncbi:MAG: AmmeMemoRadiSam system protein A [Candidatus Woesearchaeota archaeon]